MKIAHPKKLVNKNPKKQEVHFVAVKFGNKPTNLTFVNNNGVKIASRRVKVEKTKQGSRYYTLSSV